MNWLLVLFITVYVIPMLLLIGSHNEKAADVIMKSIACLGVFFWLGGFRWFT
jgi:hypothetical protein